MKKIIFSILSLVFFMNTYSAIVYTDVSPNFTTMMNYNLGSANTLISIDFDGDGTKEYDVRWDANQMFGWYMHLQHSGNNEMILSGSQNPYGASYLEILNFNDQIGPNLNNGSWGQSTPEPLFGDINNSNFQNQGEKYVGVKFFLNSSIYFGWIRVEFADETLIIHDYAYDDTPYTPILAGDNGQGNGGDILVNSITVFGENGSELVGVNQNLQMNATVLPVDATNQNVSWSVTNITGSATINASGILTGQSIGTVSVTATSTDGSNIIGTKIITINTNQINITDISVFGEFGATTVDVNQTLQIIASITPFEATVFEVEWSITNISGAGTINNSGVLTGVLPGTVSVKAKATDGTNISDSTIITITGQSTGDILVTSITVNGQNNATTVGETQSLQMEANILPQNATNQNINWTVTNGTGSATINASGILNGQTPGTVTVTAYSMDGSNISGSTVITVLQPNVSSIIIQTLNGIADVFVNETLQISAVVQPTNAANQTVSWSVTNGTGTASIDANGLLTGLTVGTVTVYATANDGTNVSGSAVITVKAVDVNTISVEGQSGVNNVPETQNLQMVASILPINATNQNVNWSVANGTGSATINSQGVLTGGNIGTVTVTATSVQNPSISGSKVVNVTEYIIYISSIEVNGENNQSTVALNNYLQMNATVLPTNANNLDYDWTVLNGSGSATISETGLLSPTSVGTVTVKAVAQDGSNVSGEKEVTITEAVGIEEIHSLASNVYPNPTNGIIQIESTKEIKTISILSLRGKLVVKRESFSNRVDISNLKNGIYIIELLNTDSSKEHHQIIKN